ncbi:nitrogen regulatory protein P-II homolog isoform X2 [Arachis stenosperma]|uniref:nitrogen regulatory protein P-II homolog isoform X2 n=1 Tax=Arachis stenosperma TaxID=217475 RepID=UPI0025AC3F96|nr:nitrogen regulatory protein P-II homolog isoform X2 [Arachis stenosperma]
MIINVHFNRSRFSESESESETVRERGREEEEEAAMAAIRRTHLFGAPSFQLREAQLRFAGYGAIPTRFRESHRNVVLARKAGNAAGILPIIRAQTPSVPEDDLEPNFYIVEAVLRPCQIPKVSSALLKMGIGGITVSDARGFGAEDDSEEGQGGSEFSEDSFIPKVKMEMVVRNDQAENVVVKVAAAVYTGKFDGGKIFMIPVSDVIRVRTGERGEQALRMAGGQSDMSSAV